MEILHRYNSDERQHYLFGQHYYFKLKPRLLYAGQLKKSGGWEEHRHSHNFCEIIFVSDGLGTITVDGKTLSIQKGDIVIYDPECSHFEKSSYDSPLEIKFFALDNFKISSLNENTLLPNGYDFLYKSEEFYETFTDYFNTLIDEFEKKEIFYVEISQNIASIMLMYIFRIINTAEQSSYLVHSSKVLDKSVNFINENFKNDINLDIIATECFVNKYYLSHLFTRFKNISIGKYILLLRINEAKNLLKNTDMSVNDISAEVGFNDVSYFCRKFKKETTYTPVQYRKSYTEKPTL